MTEPADLYPFYELVGAHCEGMLTSEQAKKLQAMLLGDAELRARYILCMHIQAVADRSLASLLPASEGVGAAEAELEVSRQSDRSGRQAEGSLQAAASRRDPNLPTAYGPPPTPPLRSPILGFLQDLTRLGNRLGSEISGASFFEWSVLGMIGTGMGMVVLMAVMLVSGRLGRAISNQGPNEGDARQVASRPEKTSSSKTAGSNVELSPNVPFLKPQASIIKPVPGEYAARLIRVADAHWLDRENDLQPGADLFSGRSIQLEAGVALFYFQGGAEVILHGPAHMVFLSRTSARLVYGSLTVTVEDPLSRGFELHTPGMKFTDLGTEFGVSVGRDGGKQEMHVFRGHVAAEAEGMEVGSWQRSVGSNDASLSTAYSLLPTPLVLAANEALKIPGPDKPVERMASETSRFIRKMSEWDQFPIFSTGVGLDRGAADPHWEITNISTDPNYKPKVAVVVQPRPAYLPDDRRKAQWISNSKAMDGMPGGCRWTLRTHFDLAGFDPATAHIKGRMLVDDFLAEMRLNGKSIGIPKASKDVDLCKHWLGLKIDEGFVPGDNLLEIVIENRPTIAMNNNVDNMALCVEWNGTARRILEAR